MDEFHFNVNLGGMIDILSNHLYSTPTVFLRELLQNAVDAISLRKSIESGFDTPEVNITVTEGSSLTFTDNGCGLTEEEIHKFISVIGQSSKRGTSGEFIGRFGIGLLSCFIVTDEIVLRTRSAKEPDRVLEWHGLADGSYSVKETSHQMEIGTEIVITAAKERTELFTFDSVLENIRYYGLPIPYPVYISSDESGKVRANMLFLKFGGNEHENALEAGKRIFGTDYDFLDYIPLESKSGAFSGAAYILPFTVSAATVNRHRIYLKNMLLTENGASLLPEWAFFVKCFFNTNTLRPTASREDFYHDEALDAAKEEISQCISAYLEKISIQKPSLLEQIVLLHGTALKSVAAENDRLFEIFMPYFSFESCFGAINGRSLSSYSDTVFYTSDIDMFRQLRPIFAEKGELIINTCYVHERALLEKLGSTGSVNIEQLSEDILRDMLADAKDAEKYDFVVSAFDEAIAQFDCRIRLKSFAPDQLATVYCINAEGELKRDIGHSKEKGSELFSDMLDVFEEEMEESASAVLYLNAANPLIQRLCAVTDADRMHVFAKILYVQALISGGFPLRSGELGVMNDNLIKLIEWGI